MFKKIFNHHLSLEFLILEINNFCHIQQYWPCCNFSPYFCFCDTTHVINFSLIMFRYSENSDHLNLHLVTDFLAIKKMTSWLVLGGTDIILYAFLNFSTLSLMLQELLFPNIVIVTFPTWPWFLFSFVNLFHVSSFQVIKKFTFLWRKGTFDLSFNSSTYFQMLLSEYFLVKHFWQSEQLMDFFTIQCCLCLHKFWL